MDPAERIKKTADSPGGLSGKPLQVLQPLAENTIIIVQGGEKIKRQAEILLRKRTVPSQARPPAWQFRCAGSVGGSHGEVKGVSDVAESTARPRRDRSERRKVR